ncbi:GFA family protein [Vibrio paucivorans]
MSKLSGSCCCGAVSFEVEDDFKRFFFCHCDQCRKLTGSAHASNLFTLPDNITWKTGQSLLQRYEHPERAFARAFCSQCGSGMPYVNKSGKFLIVPAGSLDQEPSKTPDAQIFCTEQADWHKAGLSVEKLPGFPQ